ncbi:hypothetical protein NE237_000399 [Protea cynaroides]|uniref:Gnk2-homologous domain-containing protein n=1 Tax=Protea cynaroides TaxID=273540 RepID=A0A9Q0KR62_9MAGN|nr:hypothetical protein NE237_000399 [Protea cynaroides]
MAYTGLGLLLIMLLSCMLIKITGDPLRFACTDTSGTSYTTTSNRYLTNVDLLLSSLSSNATTDTGFYNTTIGDGSDTAYGLFLCRSDITTNDCQNCVATAGKELKTRCPSDVTAIAWYDYCMIRYSNQSIFSNLEQDPIFYPYAPKDFFNLEYYNQTVSDLMYKLVRQAAFNSSSPKYYASGVENYFTGYDKVYGLVQCTHDLTKDDCNVCLTGCVYDIPNNIYPKEGGRVLKPSCNLRFEFNSVFFKRTASTLDLPAINSTSLSPSTNSTGTEGKGRSKSTLIILVVTIIIIVIMVIIFIFYQRIEKSKQKHKHEDGDDQSDITNANSLLFNFDTIKVATDNFSDANKIGEGGFGVVYKVPSLCITVRYVTFGMQCKVSNT